MNINRDPQSKKITIELDEGEIFEELNVRKRDTFGKEHQVFVRILEK